MNLKREKERERARERERERETETERERERALRKTDKEMQPGEGLCSCCVKLR